MLALALCCAAPAGAAAQLVQGQVIDSITGEPVPRSTVLLAGADGVDADRTVADARGFFLLRAPEVGRYQLIVLHEAYRRATFPPFDLGPEMRSFTLMVVSADAAPQFPDRATLALAAARCTAEPDTGVAVIVGAVSDAATGAPAPGVQVYHAAPAGGQAADSQVVGDRRGIVETDEDGIYAVCDAPVLSRIAVHAVSEEGSSGFEALLFSPVGIFAGGSFQRLTRRVWRQDLELVPTSQHTASLVGAVIDTAGNGMAGAIVQIVGTPYETRTDDSGRFVLANLTHGAVRIQARQIGFSPAEFDVDLSPGQTVDIPGEMLALGRLAVRLGDINVVGQSLRNNPGLSGFFERRDTFPRGKFVTKDDWKTWMHFNMSSILDRTRYRLENTSKMICPDSTPPSYFLDGVYLPFTPDPMPIDEIVDPSWVDAVEAYGNGFDAPPRYRRKGCAAVILIWTSQ